MIVGPEARVPDETARSLWDVAAPTFLLPPEFVRVLTGDVSGAPFVGRASPRSYPRRRAARVAQTSSAAFRNRVCSPVTGLTSSSPALAMSCPRLLLATSLPFPVSISLATGRPSTLPRRRRPRSPSRRPAANTPRGFGISGSTPAWRKVSRTRWLVRP
jgi:hypothetical protein